MTEKGKGKGVEYRASNQESEVKGQRERWKAESRGGRRRQVEPRRVVGRGESPGTEEGGCSPQPWSSPQPPGCDFAKGRTPSLPYASQSLCFSLCPVLFPKAPCEGHMPGGSRRPGWPRMSFPESTDRAVTFTACAWASGKKARRGPPSSGPCQPYLTGPPNPVVSGKVLSPSTLQPRG